MPFLRRWRGFFGRMRAWIPLGFEIGMCVMSLYAAHILLANQAYFERNEAAFAWMSWLVSDEWKWGVLALVAALLKILGFLGFFASTEAWVERAFLVRAAGWAASFVFWTCLGATLLLWNPWIITSGAALMLGVFSLGMVAAGPVMPETD